MRVAASIRVPVRRGRWERLGPPGTTGLACLPGNLGCKSSPGPVARLGCALALPAATVIVTCAPMLCMLLGGEEVWPHRQAGSPVGCLLPVVLVEAGLCSCVFASRGC